ncbi:ABC transporter ATP-binding protein [Vibrio maritimus]|uniref:ABC transporter ATP-binding protein n=1 Tax=Vibrio maritimus TaxID=990268 RepID=UPI0037363884
MNPILEVKDLKTHFFTDDGVVKAVDGVDLKLYPGRTLAILGESGCGKSITGRSIMRLEQHPGKIVSGNILLETESGTEDLVTLSQNHPKIRSIRGGVISMIFQEPMTSLGPINTIGDQIEETILLHNDVEKEEATRRTHEIMKKVGMPNPEALYNSYPFELSGGLRQRAMIAMALSCNPQVLIADEPTTALDVTTQAQILDLINELQQEMNMAVMFITHDLGVVAEIADDVAVMYMGQVVEFGSVYEIFDNPKHPYTRALMNSVPGIVKPGQRLQTIAGSVASLLNVDDTCRFGARCPERISGCERGCYNLSPVSNGSLIRCVQSQ